MKTYFLDTNILMDFLGNRKPFGKYALKIFNRARLGEWVLWCSDHSILTCYYLLEKEIGRELSKEKINQILKYIEVQPINKKILQTAMVSKFRDYEDGVQHFCALFQGKIEGIITRNKRDYKHSQIPILGPEELFEN